MEKGMFQIKHTVLQITSNQSIKTMCQLSVNILFFNKQMLFEHFIISSDLVIN